MADKPYDLEKRTFNFANDVRALIRTLKFNVQNNEDGKQVVRSSGSVGANYIESNEHISDKDFQYRIKICRKEAKESVYWLNLLKENNLDQKDTFEILADEGNQLKLIFNSMVKK